jgi:hydrogenase-4 component B
MGALPPFSVLGAGIEFRYLSGFLSSGRLVLSILILLALALLLAALLAIACAATLAPGAARAVPPVTAVLCGAGLFFDLVYLLAGAEPAALSLPVGLPGFGMSLGLDALSGFFLVPVLLAGTCAAASGPERPERSAPLLPAFLAGMLLALLAADAFGLALGFEGMSVASWGLVVAGGEGARGRRAGRLYLGMAILSGLALVGALAVLLPLGGRLPEFGFGAIRAAAALPGPAWRDVAALGLILIGAGSKAGLVPLHAWLPVAHPAAPSHVSALMSGAMTKVAAYVLVRVLFDLSGPATPAWWGVPLLVMGAASAVLGALRANIEGDMKAALASSTVENLGLIAVGLGVALLARGSDLPVLAAFALGGALLHVLNHAVFKTLLFLCAGAVQHRAGTRRFALLGGLIHRMPRTAFCAIVGAGALAALPPFSGFASVWMILQSLFATPRIGGLALPALGAVIAALVALSGGLAAAAAVRLIGVAFLGRPRSPRVAAAEEETPRRLGVLRFLALISVLLGLFPGAALILAEPALQGLTGVGLEGRTGIWAIAPARDAPAYAAPAIAALLAIAGLAAAFLLLRGRIVSQIRRGPAWDCGFAAPPPWLPFGDPATQYGGLSLAEPFIRMLGRALLGARERVDMPGPGETRAARYTLSWRDPAETWLHHPVLRLRHWLTLWANRMQFLTIRRTLVVVVSALLVLLVVLAAWGLT